MRNLRPGRSKASENESDEKSKKSNNSNSSNSSSSQSSSMRVPSFSGIIWIVQVLFWVVVAIAILYFAWRYRKELYESWLNFLEDLRNFWASLFGKKTRKHDGDRRDAKPTGPTERAVPFSDFSNPFTGGQASSMSQAQLIKYTFEALDAWGRERGITRGEDETPHEFAIALTGLDKSIARQAKILADHYCAMAFSQDPTIDPVIPQHLSNLWKKHDWGTCFQTSIATSIVFRTVLQSVDKQLIASVSKRLLDASRFCETSSRLLLFQFFATFRLPLSFFSIRFDKMGANYSCMLVAFL